MNQRMPRSRRGGRPGLCLFAIAKKRLRARRGMRKSGRIPLPNLRRKNRRRRAKAFALDVILSDKTDDAMNRCAWKARPLREHPDLIVLDCDLVSGAWEILCRPRPFASAAARGWSHVPPDITGFDGVKA